MLSDVDLFLVGKLNVLDTLKKMKEDGSDLNNIQFNYVIKKELAKLSDGFNFQICLGRLSTFQTLKESIKIGDDLNLIDLEKLIEQNLHEINNKELAKGAASLTGFKLMFNGPVSDGSENRTVKYLPSKLILDLEKCEKLLDSLLREKYAAHIMLPDEFPKQFDDAEKTRLNENPNFTRHEFDDAIEFMTLDTKLYILNKKKKKWDDIPKYVVEAFFQIKDVLNSTSKFSHDDLEKEMAFDTRLLGTMFCKKIIDFFEKPNSV